MMAGRMVPGGSLAAPLLGFRRSRVGSIPTPASITIDRDSFHALLTWVHDLGGLSLLGSLREVKIPLRAEERLQTNWTC